MKNFNLVLVLLLAGALQAGSGALAAENCQPEMVETIPDGMVSANFEAGLRKTHEVLIDMVKNAKSSIKIASMYITLTNSTAEAHPSKEPGQKLMDSLVEATKRGVKLEVLVDHSRRTSMSNADDLATLEKVSTLYRLNMTKVMGAGVMHSKFMITDDETLYVGSSNFDWRSYSHVKEIGVYFKSCPTMATDLDKIFQAYKLMSSSDQAPETLPETLRTSISMEKPYTVLVNNQRYTMYLAGSPPKVFNPQSAGRTEDLDALLEVIEKARYYINVSVMNYNIRSAYSWPPHYWPVIDNALRQAAIERRVRVNLLFSDWQNTREEEMIWYKSLNATQTSPDSKRRPLGKFGGIYVKLFKVPAYDEYQASVPFARVKHDKYIVTDNSLYVGTSNWTPEYFQNTCGVGFVFRRTQWPHTSSTIIEDMRKVFERDFESAEFARYV